MGAVGVAGGGDEASGLDASFAFDGVEADQVQGDVFEDGEIVRGMAGAGAHLVVEDNIHQCKRFSTAQ